MYPAKVIALNDNGVQFKSADNLLLPEKYCNLSRETYHEMRIPERDVTYIVLICLVTHTYRQIPTELESVPLGIKQIIRKST